MYVCRCFPSLVTLQKVQLLAHLKATYRLLDKMLLLQCWTVASTIMTRITNYLLRVINWFPPVPASEPQEYLNRSVA